MVKDGTLFMLYERKKFENMSNRKYEYINGMNGHFEIALCVDTFEEADKQFTEVVKRCNACTLICNYEAGWLYC